MSSFFPELKTTKKGQFASPEAKSLAERWMALPVGTLVKNGPGVMVYLGFTIDDELGLPMFWFWCLNTLTEYSKDKYIRHLTWHGVANCAWLKPIDAEGWDG